MADTARYFELLDHIGKELPFLIDPDTKEVVPNPADGQLQPATEWGLPYTVPTMNSQTGEIVAIAQSHVLKPIPGTRIYKVEDVLIANLVAESGNVREIDPPKKKDLDSARSATEASRNRPASGNPDITTAHNQEG